MAKPSLRINHDTLEMSTRSNRDGYVYIAIAGSDRKSLYLLYPNERDRENALVAAAGPAGRDAILVIVADAERRLDLLHASPEGSFMWALLDDRGRSRL